MVKSCSQRASCTQRLLTPALPCYLRHCAEADLWHWALLCNLTGSSPPSSPQTTGTVPRASSPSSCAPQAAASHRFPFPAANKSTCQPGRPTRVVFLHSRSLTSKAYYPVKKSQTDVTHYIVDKPIPSNIIFSYMFPSNSIIFPVVFQNMKLS